MIDILLALFLGYYYGKAEEKDKKHIGYLEETGNTEQDGVSFGYYRENETPEDLK